MMEHFIMTLKGYKKRGRLPIYVKNEIIHPNSREFIDLAIANTRDFSYAHWGHNFIIDSRYIVSNINYRMGIIFSESPLRKYDCLTSPINGTIGYWLITEIEKLNYCNDGYSIECQLVATRSNHFVINDY